MSVQNVQTTTYNFTADQSELATELGGDASAQIAAMLLDHAHDSRETTREARLHEEQHLVAQQEREFEMMMEQADHIRSAGLAEGISMMVAGTLNIAAGVVTAGTADATGTLQGRAGAEVGKAVSTSLSGGAQVSQSFGKVGAGLEEAEAQESAAAAKQATHRSGAAERRLEELRTEAQEARELVRTVIDFLRDVGRTEAATDQAGIYLRG
jgi:hypothetical protein